MLCGAALAVIFGALAIYTARRSRRSPASARPFARRKEELRHRGTFAQMQAEGWDTSIPMLWGYFFLAHDRASLVRVAKRLTALGYRRVSVEATDPDEYGQVLFQLQVERVEVHTPESLAQRNSELQALAWEEGLKSYDGWDAGLVEGRSHPVQPAV